MAPRPNVEKNDLTSGKHAKLFAAAVDFDYTAQTSGIPLKQKVARRITVPGGGSVTVTLCDGTDITLSDPGGAFHWDVQHTGIKAAGTTAANFIVTW